MNSQEPKGKVIKTPAICACFFFLSYLFIYLFFPNGNLLSFSLEEIVTSYGEVPLLRNAALTMRANSNETQSSSCLSLRKK